MSLQQEIEFLQKIREMLWKKNRIYKRSFIIAFVIALIIATASTFALNSITDWLPDFGAKIVFWLVAIVILWLICSCLAWFIFFKKKFREITRRILDFQSVNAELAKKIFKKGWLKRYRKQRRQFKKEIEEILKKHRQELQDFPEPREIRRIRRILKKLRRRFF